MHLGRKGKNLLRRFWDGSSRFDAVAPPLPAAFLAAFINNGFFFRPLVHNGGMMHVLGAEPPFDNPMLLPYDGVKVYFFFITSHP